VHFGQHDSMHV